MIKKMISLAICSISVTFFGLDVLSFAEIQSQTNPEAEQHYEKANELYKLADFGAAITEFEEVIELAPKSAIAQNAKYWIGQLYFEIRQFDAALTTFQELINEFPDSMVVSTTKTMIERVQQAKKSLALFEAVKKADVEQVRLLIAEGADIDAKWGDTHTTETHTKYKLNIADDTPLLYAVDANNMDLVELLVEAGADVNAGTWPPLVQAVEENNMAIAEYLIDHGANLNYPLDWGSLLEAVHIGNIEMIKFLIEKGADVNATEYTTPLLEAIMRPREVDKDIVDLLIQYGADVNTKGKWGYAPLDYAILLDDSYFMNILIANGAEVNIRHPWGETYLQVAARRGRTEYVKLLLEESANVNAKNDNGQTVLHDMLDIRNSDHRGYRLSKDTIELFLTKGADVNLKDKDGRTPLHLAAELADGDIVELLLDKGGKIDAKDDESGFTALHHAAQFGNKDAAELLIARGADINAKDKQGHTPLYVAINHDYQVTELLINKGADTAIRTESGRTLLQLAQQRKRMESKVPDMVFDGNPDSAFGSLIACGDVDGNGHDDVLIGAVGYNNKRGRVCLFYGGPDMDTTADLILEGQNEGDRFGYGITCADIDNDGHDDIIVAADGYSEKRGRVYLFWGSDRNSMDADPDKIFVGEERKGSLFGGNSPVVYDIDNDGYDDIILGSFWNQDDGIGRAYLYYGNTKELMDTSHDLIFTAEDPRDQYTFGLQIACGDVDNDGYGDIVIGSQGYPTSKQQVRAHLYYGGSRSNMDAKADVMFEVKSEGRHDRYGCGILCIDQNRDGYDDVVVGAPRYNDRQGRAYLFHGNSKRGLDTDPDMILDGEVRGGSFGHSAVCGNIDGDSLNDIIIRARDFGQRAGRVYVYWGNELATPDPKPGRILTGENPNDKFGQGLACGDINNDGFDDLVIGAYGYKAGTYQGRAYLYYGGPKDK